MTEPAFVPPPAWVAKRDGRLEPFDADKISRSLFAATEARGRPDAFMARELTDGVVHFLKAETGTATPSTAQIAELVAKVVRELGQPALAQAYADRPRKRPRAEDRGAKEASVVLAPASPPAVGPTLAQVADWVKAEPPPVALRRAGAACLREFALREVFTRDLIAAQSEGLMTLTGLDAPAELYGYRPDVRPAAGGDLTGAVAEARALAGRLLAFDGLEHALGLTDLPAAKAAAAAVRQIRVGLELTGLRGVVNLNSASPPGWAYDLAEGPLFGPHAPVAPTGMGRGIREALIEAWELAGPATPVRLDWHLGDKDFDEAGRGRLLALARLVLGDFPLTFVFDRPRRPVSLAEGLDRQHPGVLLMARLHLARLREQQGIQSDPDAFLRKLGSLARLALSAGVQKRDFLRKHGDRRPELTRGFFLERARLVVVPTGLDAAVRALQGKGMAAGGAALEFARQIVRRLREVLEQDGRATHLDACLDSGTDFLPDDTLANSQAPPPLERVAGLTAWDAGVRPRQQLKAAGAVHAVAERGTAAVLLPGDGAFSAEEAVEALGQAWRQTEVHRVRLIPAAQPRRQLTAPWEKE